MRGGTLRQREPRQEDKAFLAFVRTQPCCGCGQWPPVQAAHLRRACPERGKRETGGGETASDRWAVPLCTRCHLDAPDSLHRTSEKGFFRRIGVDPFALAAALYAEFENPNRIVVTGPPVDSIDKVTFFPCGNASRAPRRPSQVKRTSDSGVKVRCPKRKKADRPRLYSVGVSDSGKISLRFAVTKSAPKMKSRPLRSASRWPKGRKINGRKSP